MTEAEWRACGDPAPMLGWLGGRVSDRQLRLFAVACCRHIWPLLADDRARRAVRVAEAYADGAATDPDRRAFAGGRYFEAAVLSDTLLSAVGAAGWTVALPLTVTEAGHCAANALEARLHHADESGSVPYGLDEWPVSWGRAMEPVRVAGRAAQASALRDIVGNPFRPAALAPGWLTAPVVALAGTMYEARDFGPMPVLADALEEAGCDQPDILTHCRSDGPHVRGCWVVDLVLGKV